MKKISKRSLPNMAWVTGWRGNYELRVSSYDKRTKPWQHLDRTWFGDYRAAQAMANAIRAEVYRRHGSIK